MSKSARTPERLAPIMPKLGKGAMCQGRPRRRTDCSEGTPPYRAFGRAPCHHQPATGGLLRYDHRIASSELREAAAEGPIFFRGLENVHEHVLRPDAGAF